MIQELNLVRIPAIDSKTGNLLSRKRYQIENGTDAMEKAARFLSDCSADFRAALTDKRFVDQLSSLEFLTVTQFDCIRYILAQNSLDIWMGIIPDSNKDDNPDDIPTDVLEYNIFDRNMQFFESIPMITKFYTPKEGYKPSQTYKKIMDAYGLFDSPIFSGLNPFKNSIDVLKRAEDTVGVVPVTVITYLNASLDLLNKDLRIISM